MAFAVICSTLIVVNVLLVARWPAAIQSARMWYAGVLTLCMATVLQGLDAGFLRTLQDVRDAQASDIILASSWANGLSMVLLGLAMFGLLGSLAKRAD